MSAAARDGKPVKTYLELVKFEHTVFALPFAYAGMLLASLAQNGTWWPGFSTFFWVTVAMAAARTAAMAANRVIDRAIDARNPRTAGREVPSGKVSPAQAWALVGVSVVVLLFAAWQLNPLCVALLPLALQVPEQEPLRPEPAAVGEAPTPRRAVYRCAGLPWCLSP